LENTRRISLILTQINSNQAALIGGFFCVYTTKSL